MAHALRITPSAQRDLDRLGSIPKGVRDRIASCIDSLADDPFPPGHRKIVGEVDTYRVRVGDYRVVYTVMEEPLTVTITAVRHRRDVYRRR